MTLTTSGFAQLADMLDADVDPDEEELYRPRWNIAPTDPHWIVRLQDGKRRLRRARWGLKKGSSSGKPRLVINIRGETFKKRLPERRCLVPADGFYEWTGPKEARRPIWFHAPTNEVLLLAGTYDETEDAPFFTVLTTDANPVVAPVHDRMPVVLPPEKARAWLEEPLAGLLAPADPAALIGTPVSPRANSVKNDDPACLEPPVDEAPPPGQIRLF
jgi:putative SOS response-associated peptidase YedK